MSILYKIVYIYLFFLQHFNKFAYTFFNGQFLLHKDDDMIIFGSDDGLNALSHSTRWQSDGTFSTAPTGFYQLYTIHCLYMWQMITCLWILLSGKSENLYKKILG